MQKNGHFALRFIGALGSPLVLVFLLLASPAFASTGCSLTFRHGGTVIADRCQEMGNAVAYQAYGGWVVVLKSQLVSVADQTGIRRFNPRWTPEEERARLEAVPKQGGVPVAATTSEAPAPPPPPPPTVVYVPVPTPAPAQPVYQLPPPYAYSPVVVFCPHCFKPHRVIPHKFILPIAPVRVVPTSPSDIGPMAIQKSFPPISPIRR